MNSYVYRDVKRRIHNATHTFRLITYAEYEQQQKMKEKENMMRLKKNTKKLR